VKKLALVLITLAAGGAFAQEIGTEITPVTPSSNPQTPPPSETQEPQPEKKQGYTYQPQGGAKKAEPGAGEASGWAGPKASASSGDFGLRAGFGASAQLNVPATSAAASSFTTPTVGVAYFASDTFKLLFDLGFGLGIAGSNPLLAIGAMVGFDLMFRTPADSLRPFFHAAAMFTMGGSLNNPVLGTGAQAGFGAEFFFAPQFSVNGRLLLVVPVTLSPNFLFGLFTVSPGIGATWYL
jgi:hypothetical protein